MRRRPPCSAFTLVEMLVVMAIIAILTGLILSLNSVVQNNAAHSRARSEIRAMSAAIEAYKADNGGYPQGSPSTKPQPMPGQAALTDQLDPNPASMGANTFSTFDANPNDYNTTYPVTLFLWQQLSGQLNSTDSTKLPTGTNYAGDFFKPSVLSGTVTNGRVTSVSYIIDPFGNPYGYSTAGLFLDQAFRTAVLANGTLSRANLPQGTIAGFNPTFDLWSTGGATTTSTNGSATPITPTWEKNW